MGLIASAAVGVVDKVITFAMLPPMSFMSTIAAFTAQNMGAGQPDRAKKAMRYCMAISLVFGVAFCVFVQFSGTTLTRLFSSDPAVIAAGASYLKSFSIDCILVCFIFTMTGFLNGCGKTLFVMMQSLLTTFFVRIPLSWLISRKAGVTMYDIGFAAPAASIVGIILLIAYMKRGTWRNVKVR
jgi:Na+-driven multidrug efflux pump